MFSPCRIFFIPLPLPFLVNLVSPFYPSNCNKYRLQSYNFFPPPLSFNGSLQKKMVFQIRRGEMCSPCKSLWKYYSRWQKQGWFPGIFAGNLDNHVAICSLLKLSFHRLLIVLSRIVRLHACMSDGVFSRRCVEPLTTRETPWIARANANRISSSRQSHQPGKHHQDWKSPVKDWCITWTEAKKWRWKNTKKHPTSRTFLLLSRFWRTREKNCMNRTRTLLSMRCIFLGYSFEPRPNIRSLGTTGSVMNIGLSINGCSRTKTQFDERKPDWLVQSRLLARHWKLAVQKEACFPIKL